MKKKIIAVITALSMVISPFTAFANNISISAETKAIENVYAQQNVTMVSVKETAEKLGFTVTYKKNASNLNTVTVTDGIVKANIMLEKETYATSDYMEVKLEAKPEIKEGDIYVPVSFFETFFFVEQSTQKDGSIALKNKKVTQPTALGEFASLTNGNWYNLTKQQKLQDIDYLYKIVKENYPYIHVLKRMYNVDLEQEYKTARKQTENCKTDAEFYTIIEQFTRKANMVGHLSTISPFDYNWFVAGYADKTSIPEDYWEQMDKIENVYANQNSQKAYWQLQNKMYPVYQKVQDYYAAKQPQQQSTQKRANVETKIIEKDKIAYIYVGSLDMSGYEADKKKLFDFYKQVENYDNVIFDFTENGGGSMFYFNDLIVAPNIDKMIYTNVYQLMQAGEYNTKFFGKENFEPISHLPKLPKMNQEDLKDLDLMLESSYFVEPLQKQKMLKGKLWLLVNENVFSSSEYAAMFSKATGFATLVGEKTGGDGIGSDPLPIALPNSGIIVRYSPIYGVTADGANSQEFGTTPDIVRQAGKTYLQTCIDEIKKAK